MFDGTMGLNAGDSIGALMACGRMGMGVLFFVILMVATHKVETFKELKAHSPIALGGLMIGMSLACYVTSTLLTTVANAVLFIYTGPVICVLAARIFRKEPMSGLQWICLLVVFIGMLFGEGLLGFVVGGQVFGLDFSLETSTPGSSRRRAWRDAWPSVWPVLRPVDVLQRLPGTPTPRPAACGTSSSPCWAPASSPSS